MTTHAYVYTVACALNSRLLSGHLGVVAGMLRGFIFPVCYGSVGVQLTRLRALCQGTLTSECVSKNLNATILQLTCTIASLGKYFILPGVFALFFCLDVSIWNFICIAVVVVSHIQRIGCQPEKKLLYTVANPARSLLNRERKKRKKKKVWQRPPPPPPPPPRARCSFGENKK